MSLVDGTVLVLEGGPYSGKTFILSARTTLGREEENDVVITDPGVSRGHAVIVQSGQGYYLRDLSSTNGTFVNQRNISNEDYFLKTGDCIRLGRSDVSLIFQLPTRATVQMTIEYLLEEMVSSTKDEMPPVASQEPAEPEDNEERYEGRVVLNVQAEGNMVLLLKFVQTLRESPHFQFFRFLTDPRRGVDIWLGLREPMPLPQVLMEMGNVAEVIPGQSNGDAHDDDGPVFTVVLAE